MQTVGEHPDADLLTAFAEQSLAGTERERLLAHLAACASCREVVSLAMPQEAEPAEVATPAASWFRWPVLRWTAVAATVIVVGAAVSVLYQRNRPVEVAVPATESAPGPKTAEPAEAVNEPLPDQAQRGENAKKIASAPESEQARERQSDKAKQPAATASASRDNNATGFALAIPSQKPVEPPTAGVGGKLDAGAVNSEIARKDAPAAHETQKGALGGVVAGVAGGMSSKSEKVMADQVAAPPPPPALVAQDKEVAAKRAATATAATAQNEAVNVLRAAPQSGQTATAAAPAASPMTLSKAKIFTAARWRVSSAGAVEHSADGKTWEKVEIDPSVTFRAMSSNAGDLWAGGTGGSLFHSADAGRTWSRVKVGDDGMWVSDAITAVDFPNPRHGAVTTQSGAIWTTQDGGRTWQRRQ